MGDNGHLPDFENDPWAVWKHCERCDIEVRVTRRMGAGETPSMFVGMTLAQATDAWNEHLLEHDD